MSYWFRGQEQIKFMTRKIRVIRIVFPYVTLFIFLFTTNPQTLPSVLLVLPFICLAGALFYTFQEILTLLSRHRWLVNVQRPRAIAALLTSFLVLLLVMGSTGQLTFKDVLTTGTILLVAHIYFARFAVIGKLKS